jgi:hypothetical protein
VTFLVSFLVSLAAVKSSARNSVLLRLLGKKEFKTQTPMACRFLPMYNVAKAVGTYRPNQTEDVKLIQSLLKALKQVSDPNLEGSAAITVTGVFTPVLGQTILQYQTKCIQKGATMVADGVIDPLPSKSGLERGLGQDLQRRSDEHTLGTLLPPVPQESKPVFQDR